MRLQDLSDDVLQVILCEYGSGHPMGCDRESVPVRRVCKRFDRIRTGHRTWGHLTGLQDWRAALRDGHRAAHISLTLTPADVAELVTLWEASVRHEHVEGLSWPGTGRMESLMIRVLDASPSGAGAAASLVGMAFLEEFGAAGGTPIGLAVRVQCPCGTRAASSLAPWMSEVLAPLVFAAAHATRPLSLLEFTAQGFVCCPPRDLFQPLMRAVRPITPTVHDLWIQLPNMNGCGTTGSPHHLSAWDHMAADLGVILDELSAGGTLHRLHLGVEGLPTHLVERMGRMWLRDPFRRGLQALHLGLLGCVVEDLDATLLTEAAQAPHLQDLRLCLHEDVVVVSGRQWRGLAALAARCRHWSLHLSVPTDDHIHGLSEALEARRIASLQNPSLTNEVHLHHLGCQTGTLPPTEAPTPLTWAANVGEHLLWFDAGPHPTPQLGRWLSSVRAPMLTVGWNVPSRGTEAVLSPVLVAASVASMFDSCAQAGPNPHVQLLAVCVVTLSLITDADLCAMCAGIPRAFPRVRHVRLMLPLPAGRRGPRMRRPTFTGWCAALRALCVAAAHTPSLVRLDVILANPVIASRVSGRWRDLLDACLLQRPAPHLRDVRICGMKHPPPPAVGTLYGSDVSVHLQDTVSFDTVC